MIEILARLLLAALFIFAASLGARFLAPVIARAVVSTAEARRGRTLSSRRSETMHKLATHLTQAIAYVVAVIFALSLFVNSTGLFTFLGLFSAAFGLGARPLVSDYLSGIIFLFEDQYTVGEKVEIFGIEGTVINVDLRTTILRAPSGELYIIPNGEVRVVRNFGRGEFSLASVRISIKSSQLERSLAALEEVLPTIPARIPELVEPPRILSEDGALGERIDLTVFAKARFSQGADARRKLLAILQDTLSSAGIDSAT